MMSIMKAVLLVSFVLHGFNIGLSSASGPNFAYDVSPPHGVQLENAISSEEGGTYSIAHMNQKTNRVPLSQADNNQPPAKKCKVEAGLKSCLRNDGDKINKAPVGTTERRKVHFSMQSHGQ